MEIGHQLTLHGSRVAEQMHRTWSIIRMSVRTAKPQRLTFLPSAGCDEVGQNSGCFQQQLGAEQATLIQSISGSTGDGNENGNGNRNGNRNWNDFGTSY